MQIKTINEMSARITTIKKTVDNNCQGYGEKGTLRQFGGKVH